MDTVRKCLVILGINAMGVIGILLMIKAAKSRHQRGTYEKVGKGLDERLNESKAALDKATAQVLNIFEHIKNRKPL
jgi:hypothetical protein